MGRSSCSANAIAPDMGYLFRGVLIGLLFGVPAGAVGAMTAQRAYSFGLWAGLLTGLGSSVADCLYACVGAFGLSLISDFLLAHQTIINLLGGEVINVYGASESLALGVDDGSGMLLFDDLNVVEAVDGEMYLTSLYNFAQPLIRYYLTDSLTLADPRAGSPFTRAAGLLGRCEDMLWFEDGFGHRDFLHPLAIEGFCVEGLRDYQFRQTGRDSFVMIAEKTSQGRESVIQAEIIAQMREILEEKGLGYVRFQVTFVEEILPDPRTGKKQLIMKNDAERWRAAG